MALYTAPFAPSSPLMIRRDGLAFPAAAHRCSARYSPPSGDTPLVSPSRGVLLFRRLCKKASEHCLAHLAAPRVATWQKHLYFGSAPALNTHSFLPSWGINTRHPFGQTLSLFCPLAVYTALQIPPNLQPHLPPHPPAHPNS
jgi:hypothetical protein